MFKGKNNLWFTAIVLLCLGIMVFSTFAPFAAENENADDTPEINPPEMIPYRIQVVDSKTGRGVPMIQLQTMNGSRYYTDSAGYVSFYDPGLMDQDVFFLISGPGYVFPKNSMGAVGQRVSVRPGLEFKFQVDKVDIAERLYRVTGQGIYRDSVAMGLNVPIEEPILNSKVMKHGSAQVIEFKGKLYWFFGDTYSSSKTEGNYRVAGAVSDLPSNGGLDPDAGVNLNYFTGKDGFVKELVPDLPGNEHSVEISSLMKAVKDGKECLLAGYTSYTKNGLAISNGILLFNDQKEQFELVKEFKEDDKRLLPVGSAVLYEDKGKEYWVFCNPFPIVRVANDYNSIIDQSKYEAFTPLKSGTVFNSQDTRKTEIERDKSGKAIWGWKKNTAPLSQEEESRLVRTKVLESTDKTYSQFIDIDTDKATIIKSASIQYNKYAKKWIMLAQSRYGKEPLGDIYYAEADTPMGPWDKGRVVISHTDYAFNNPVIHPYFSKENGKIIYFSGNYDNNSSKSKPTPYYDSNQLMYRLNLDDPKLELAN